MSADFEVHPVGAATELSHWRYRATKAEARLALVRHLLSFAERELTSPGKMAMVTVQTVRQIVGE